MDVESPAGGGSATQCQPTSNTHQQLANKKPPPPGFHKYLCCVAVLSVPLFTGIGPGLITYGAITGNDTVMYTGVGLMAASVVVLLMGLIPMVVLHCLGYDLNRGSSSSRNSQLVVYNNTAPTVVVPAQQYGYNTTQPMATYGQPSQTGYNPTYGLLPSQTGYSGNAPAVSQFQTGYPIGTSLPMAGPRGQSNEGYNAQGDEQTHIHAEMVQAWQYEQAQNRQNLGVLSSSDPLSPPSYEDALKEGTHQNC